MPQTLAYDCPVISIDVEDWPQSTWNHDLPISRRAATNTRHILELLREAGVHGTMFVLGKLAEAFPEIVRLIHDEGHEVACHGYGHVEIFRQTPREFCADVRRAKDTLEQILGKSVRGYRAPDFSIVDSTLWALEILAEAGFEYDSSIFPVRARRYGIPEWPNAPVRVSFGNACSILEFPIGTLRCLDVNIPIGGGGYHRLLPGFVMRHLVRSAIRSAPFVFYCHPYELDTAELRELPLKIPWFWRLHQGLGRQWFKQRLTSFLAQFGGQRMEDLLSLRTWKYPNIAFGRLATIPKSADCA